MAYAKRVQVCDVDIVVVWDFILCKKLCIVTYLVLFLQVFPLLNCVTLRILKLFTQLHLQKMLSSMHTFTNSLVSHSVYTTCNVNRFCTNICWSLLIYVYIIHMWVYKSYCMARMTVQLADRTCVVRDWVRGDHPWTAARNKGTVPYKLDASFLTFSFDYPTASSWTQFLSADFCYSCVSRVDVPWSYQWAHPLCVTTRLVSSKSLKHVTIILKPATT